MAGGGSQIALKPWWPMHFTWDVVVRIRGVGQIGMKLRLGIRNG
jgi:hypothetical protein